MDGRRRVSRAAAVLRRAQSSPCGTCGRTTKTAEGVCADCWAPKEATARRFARRRDISPTFLDAFIDDDAFIPGLDLVIFGVLVLALLIAVVTRVL